MLPWGWPVSAVDPDLSALGLGAPTLGPWFSAPDLVLPLPAGGLALPLSLPPGTVILPPTTGQVVLGVADGTARWLDGLRGVDGASPFAPGAVLVAFRVFLPVEERLHALTARQPSLDRGADPTARSRPRTRWLILELPPGLDWTALDPATGGLLPAARFPPTLSTDADRAAFVGLDWDGQRLTNAERPVQDLTRPGQFLGAREELGTVPPGPALNVVVHAFDDRGRPLDPGAVATAWRHLADDRALWAPGLAPADRRTVAAQPGLSVHLLGAHEGLLAPGVLAAIADSAAGGRARLRTVRPGLGVQQLTLSVDPALAGTTLPALGLGLRPAGTTGPTVTLDLARGFVREHARIVVVEREQHLTGEPRAAAPGAPASAQQRAVLQAQASTRVAVAPAAAPVACVTTEPTTAALLAVLATPGPAVLVAEQVERRWGVVPALPLPDVPVPAQLPALGSENFAVLPLRGGGRTEEGLVFGQRVLLRLRLDPGAVDSPLAGAWVRIWPQGVDLGAGARHRLDGGGARVAARDGEALVVVALPDGPSRDSQLRQEVLAALGLDLLVLTARGSLHRSDLRLERPGVIGGSVVSENGLQDDDLVVICETGERTVGGLGAGRLPSGCTVVVLPGDGGPAALLDTATLPAERWSDPTLLRVLGPAHTVQTAVPAWRGQPLGDRPAQLGATGAAVTERPRGGLEGWVPGTPLPGMEQPAVVAVVAGPGGLRGAVGSAPLSARTHALAVDSRGQPDPLGEPGHRWGHPGVPAAVEVHGAGAALDGPAAALLHETVRELTQPSLPALAAAALAAPPAVAPAPTPSCWAAVLSTAAAGVSEVSGASLDALDLTLDLDALNTWLAAQGIGLPDLSAADGPARARVLRALHRRLRAARDGAQEAGRSLQAAMARAEDLVYIETPTLDALAVGPADDPIQLLATLGARLDARPALRVVICTPVHLPTGRPSYLERVRREVLAPAVQQLQAGAGRAERVVWFQPSAGVDRTVRIASTAVVVDDCYALVGTSHLWRRGLSWDRSVAVAFTDDRLDPVLGRPAEVVRLRRALLAGRLGLAPQELPDEPAALVVMLQRLAAQGGGGRLATARPFLAPDRTTSLVDPNLVREVDIWNRDGTDRSANRPSEWLADVLGATQDDSLHPAP